MFGASIQNISFSVPGAVSLAPSRVPLYPSFRRLSLETTQTYYNAVVDLHNCSTRGDPFFSAWWSCAKCELTAVVRKYSRSSNHHLTETHSRHAHTLTPFHRVCLFIVVFYVKKNTFGWRVQGSLFLWLLS